MSVVLPAPVGPTTATRDPPGTLKEMFFSVSTRSLYAKQTSLNSSSPRDRPMSMASSFSITSGFSSII